MKNFPADNKGRSSSTHLAWDHTYRLTVMAGRGGTGPGLHEEKTQLYIMVDGTGRIGLGGEADRENPPKQGPVKGASVYNIKPGDIVIMAPYTWHELFPDPGQTFTYIAINIPTDTIPYP